MTNTFMAEFYAQQAAEVAKSKKLQANMVADYDARMANFIPTPTVAEMTAVANDGLFNGVVTLAGSLKSPNKKMLPGPALLNMQRKFPSRV